MNFRDGTVRQRLTGSGIILEQFWGASWVEVEIVDDFAQCPKCSGKDVKLNVTTAQCNFCGHIWKP